MTRLIDADSVYKWYLEAFKGQIKPNEIRFSMNDIRDNLQNIPTVDAVPVVRCAECYFWDKEPSQTAMPEVHTCRYWRIGTTCIDYCARASRDGWLKAMSGEVKNDRQR